MRKVQSEKCADFRESRLFTPVVETSAVRVSLTSHFSLLTYPWVAIVPSGIKELLIHVISSKMDSVPMVSIQKKKDPK